MHTLPDELLLECRLFNTLNRRSIGTENILNWQLLMNNRVVTQAAIYTMKFNPQGTAIASGSHDREICKFHIPFSWIQAFFWLRHIGFSNDVTAKILGMFDNNYSEVGLVLSC